jgi:hypothetical protein
MGLDESGQNHPAIQSDHFGLRSDQLFNVRRRARRGDVALANGERLDDVFLRIERDDFPPSRTVSADSAKRSEGVAKAAVNMNAQTRWMARRVSVVVISVRWLFMDVGGFCLSGRRSKANPGELESIASLFGAVTGIRRRLRSG